MENVIETTQQLLSKNAVNGLQSPLFSSSFLLAAADVMPRLEYNNVKKDVNVRTCFELLVFAILMLPLADSQANCCVFQASATLLTSIFTVLHNCDIFNDYKSIGHFFASMCEKFNLTDVIDNFEQVNGVSFKEHFSFALAFLMMKGLTNSTTRENTTALFKKLIAISVKQRFLTEYSLGFIASLVPFEHVYTSSHYMQQLFRKEVFKNPRNETAFLFQRFLFIILEDETVPENSKIAVYAALLFAFEKMHDVYSKLPITMNQVLKVFTQNSSDSIVKCALTLINYMTATNYNMDINSLGAKEIDFVPGFFGVKEQASFAKAKQDKQFVSIAVKFLVKVVQLRAANVNSRSLAIAKTVVTKEVPLQERKMLSIKSKSVSSPKKRIKTHKFEDNVLEKVMNMYGEQEMGRKSPMSPSDIYKMEQQLSGGAANDDRDDQAEEEVIEFKDE